MVTVSKRPTADAARTERGGGSYGRRQCRAISAGELSPKMVMDLPPDPGLVRAMPTTADYVPDDRHIAGPDGHQSRPRR